jgi:hypothetical protein
MIVSEKYAEAHVSAYAFFGRSTKTFKKTNFFFVSSKIITIFAP